MIPGRQHDPGVDPKNTEPYRHQVQAEIADFIDPHQDQGESDDERPIEK
jgi:hypothetical protein